ncbi:MAG TPA: hypothetical protein VNQ33_07700, partial [Acidimicrobiales bacterium]|nr:hypothetical protein [Acidimicrobiales bacterium]
MELTTSKARRFAAGLVLVATAVAGQGLSTPAGGAAGGPPGATTSAAAPTPTAAVPGKPTVVAAVG